MLCAWGGGRQGPRAHLAGNGGGELEAGHDELALPPDGPAGHGVGLGRRRLRRGAPRGLPRQAAQQVPPHEEGRLLVARRRRRRRRRRGRRLPTVRLLPPLRHQQLGGVVAAGGGGSGLRAAAAARARARAGGGAARLCAGPRARVGRGSGKCSCWHPRVVFVRRTGVLCVVCCVCCAFVRACTSGPVWGVGGWVGVRAHACVVWRQVSGGGCLMRRRLVPGWLSWLAEREGEIGFGLEGFGLWAEGCGFKEDGPACPCTRPQRAGVWV